MAAKKNWIKALEQSELATVFPWQFVTSRQLAKALGVHLQTLANWRVRDVGPTPAPTGWFVGRPARYQLGHVWVWAYEQSGIAKRPWEINADWLRVHQGGADWSKREDVQSRVSLMSRLDRAFRPADLTSHGRKGIGLT